MPIDNPFSTDTSIPNLSPSGSEQAFDFDSGLSNTKPSTTFPWKTVAIIEGILLFLIFGSGILVLLITLIFPRLINPPDKVVRAYYDALETQNYNLLGNYFDPDATLTGNIIPMAGILKLKLEEVAGKQLGTDINIAWDFQNLEFKIVEQQNTVAKVKVTGKVRIYEVDFNLGVALPYEWTHNLIKKNGQWYISP